MGYNKIIYVSLKIKIKKKQRTKILKNVKKYLLKSIQMQRRELFFNNRRKKQIRKIIQERQR